MPFGGLLTAGLLAGGTTAYSAYKGSKDDKANREGLAESNYLREKGTQKALEEIGGLSRPIMSDLQQKRLAALEEESKPTTLAENPLFQGERTRMLQSGAGELSGIGNIRKAYGLGQGGFSNVGSEMDTADRLGVQLSDLAQRARFEREGKRDAAAQLQNEYESSLTNFYNAQKQARAAIYMGDAQAANAALQTAIAARQSASNAQAQMVGQVGAMGGQVLGGYMASQRPAPVYNSGGGYAGGGDWSIPSADTLGSYGNPSTQTEYAPFASMQRSGKYSL